MAGAQDKQELKLRSGGEANLLARLVADNALASGRFLQAHYLSTEPQLMDILWHIASMPPKARKVLQAYFKKIEADSRLEVKRSGETLTIAAAPVKGRPLRAKNRKRMQ